MRVIGYVRVSTEEQGLSGAGLEAQRSAIVAECERRGWDLVRIEEDVGRSGKDLGRPGVRAALEALRTKDASALVVAKLDRLSRSTLHFAQVMAAAQKQQWALIALDVAVDTSTPSGEALVNMLATFAQFERRLISLRTTEALEVRRREGVRLGRPPEIDGNTAARIVQARRGGDTLRQIADSLNDDRVATARGGKWAPSTVARVLSREATTSEKIAR